MNKTVKTNKGHKPYVKPMMEIKELSKSIFLLSSSDPGSESTPESESDPIDEEYVPFLHNKTSTKDQL